MLWNLGDLAKSLNIPNFGRNSLFDFCRKQKILNHNNVPYQKYIDLGYFRIIRQRYYTGSVKHISMKPVLTERGAAWLETKVREELGEEIRDLQELWG